MLYIQCFVLDGQMILRLYHGDKMVLLKDRYPLGLGWQLLGSCHRRLHDRLRLNRLDQGWRLMGRYRLCLVLRRCRRLGRIHHQLRRCRSLICQDLVC